MNCIVCRSEFNGDYRFLESDAERNSTRMACLDRTRSPAYIDCPNRCATQAVIVYNKHDSVHGYRDMISKKV